MNSKFSFLRDGVEKPYYVEAEAMEITKAGELIFFADEERMLIKQMVVAGAWQSFCIHDKDCYIAARRENAIQKKEESQGSNEEKSGKLPQVTKEFTESLRKPCAYKESEGIYEKA